jgi:hypothetical protein
MSEPERIAEATMKISDASECGMLFPFVQDFDARILSNPCDDVNYFVVDQDSFPV